MLEEVGVEHELRFVDLMAGEHKKPDMISLNPMGKLPILKDGDVVVTETAAIGLYLADRYSSGKLAPAPDDPGRGTYLRWSMFAPAVIEPGLMAKMRGWEYGAAQAGWGDHDSMLIAMESAVSHGFILGDRFSMADIIFGATVRFMLGFGMLEKRPAFTAYVERLEKRPALQRADERGAAICKERGIEQPGG